MGLVKLTYVTGPDKPCNVSGEVRPPKVVNDVCSCHEVSVMSSGVMSSSENFWSLVTVDDYFMMTLWVLLPQMAIHLEEVFGISRKRGICGIGESQRTFGGLEPFAKALQIVVGVAGSIRSGEKVIGEWWLVSDGVGDVCRGQSQTWNLWFEWVEKVYEPIDLVNPIIELWVFCGFSIFISRLLQSLGEAVRAMSSTGDVDEGEVEQQDGGDPAIHAGGRGKVRIR